jgi:hypothetical protein
VTTARNRAIDRIRRERTLAQKIQLLPVPETAMDVMDEFDDAVIKDERLELIFTCCHPALPLDGQVALTLRTLGGLETAEIARAFLGRNRSMNVMIVRAKIKEENVADAQAATDKVIQALEQAHPADVRYTVAKLSDGVTLLAFLKLEPGQEHPLRTLPAYAEMLENLKEWYAEPPTVEHMTVVGSYQLF